MGIWGSYKLRLRRRRLRLRARRKRRELKSIADRTGAIRSGDLLLFSTFRNEAQRLPYFLKYYRDLGIDHFLMVDNGSDDGGGDLLAGDGDVSLWRTEGSYKAARFGMDWLNGLQSRYGHDHWCLTVDPDEFLVYPFCDTRPLRALTDWLDATQIRSFGAMLLDMYPKGDVRQPPYVPGQDPLEIAPWFDPGNYAIAPNPGRWNLWIQGGPRARMMFPDEPAAAPALNKVPLVRWHRRYTWESSTHMVLPRGLNLVHDLDGGEKASGVLLHMKFLDGFDTKAEEELRRGEHYAGSREYAAYAAAIARQPDLWTRWSERYINWRQLEILGLMSKGNWA